MSRFYSVRPMALGLLLLTFAAASLPAAPAKLSPAQEARLKSALPKLTTKLQRRELIRVVSLGDSISSFYQVPGFPRYDSAMAWQGRLLNRLGGYFFYHGVTDLDPHREITSSQKAATAAWDRFAGEMEVWQRTKKGSAPAAPDALRFQADLESPMKMRVPELVRRGLPAAQQGQEGTVIEIHNLARDGSHAPQAMEALTTGAFPAPPLRPPDLVTICYGVNDSVINVSLDGFRGFLTTAVEYCQKRGAEVLLAAPPVSYDPDLPRISIGRSRPYAQIVREVATATGAAFVDLGSALVEAPSELVSLTAQDAFAAAMVPLARDFSYRSDIVDILHPNAAATLRMGEGAAQQLLGGPTGTGIQLSGSIEILSPEEATITLRVINATPETQTVALSPLSFTGWQVKPSTPDGYFTLPPGKVRRFSLPMIPSSDTVGPDRGVVRGSLIVSDDDLQQIADVSLPVRPVAILWPEARIDGATGDVLLAATLTHQGYAPLRGTASIQWEGRSQEVPFSLEPGTQQPLPIRLALPDATTTPRFKKEVAVVITLPDRTLRFTRHLEGVRHVGLEQRFPLVPLEPGPAGSPVPEPDTWVTPFADSRGVYFTLETTQSSSTALPAGVPWGSVEIQLDGRKAGANGTAGFIDRITAPVPAQDGRIPLRRLRPAVFGLGYDLEYHPDGFLVSATTRADGSRRIEFNIARVNLAYHEWSLDGSGQSTLGFNIRLSRNDPITGQPNPSATRVITASGFDLHDAQSLTVLELSRTPAPRWSLRIW